MVFVYILSVVINGNVYILSVVNNGNVYILRVVNHGICLHSPCGK